MAWKTINGHRYFYKSERVGRRVKSTYFGAGESGSLMAGMVAFERSERAAGREQLREARAAADSE
jgi:phage protein U